MFRRCLLLAVVLLPGCSGASRPGLQPDAETINRAVQHAQAQVDRPAGQERRR